MSRFLSCVDDKVFHFFATLKKKVKFEWTSESEDAFVELKTFLATPSVLTHPQQCVLIFLYVSVIDKAMSFVLVKEKENNEKLVYFVNKVFKGAKLRL